MQPDDGLSRTRLRLGHVLVNQFVGTFKFVQSNSFHVAPFGRSGIGFQATSISLMVFVARYRQRKAPTGFVVRSASRRLYERRFPAALT
jgi:hypothetical protein